MIAAPGDDSRDDRNTAHPPIVLFMQSCVEAQSDPGPVPEIILSVNINLCSGGSMIAFLKTVSGVMVLVALASASMPARADAVIGSVASGMNPYAIVVNTATNKIYMMNIDSNDVTVIDGATNSTSTVRVGSSPFHIAVNTVTNRIYVVNFDSNDVTVIDGATNTTSTVAIAVPLWGVVVNQTTNKIYALSIGDSIAIIDGVTNTVDTLTVRSSPASAAINEQTNEIYVTHWPSDSVSAINGAANSISIVATQPGPYGLAVNATTNKIYVSNTNSDSITIIDGASNTASFLAVGAGPGPLAVNPVTNRIYVASTVSNTVAVIDGAAGNSPISSTVIEFHHAALDHYFITADPNEAAAIDGGSGAGTGWARTGNTFKAGGSTPVCRFYGSPHSPGPNSHFYTVDKAECDGLKRMAAASGGVARWNFESFDFVSSAPVNGTCSAGTVPVYRAYNDAFRHGRDSNHRITSSPAAIQQVVDRGWIDEGVVMCAPA
jgi:YVTN family beta-propeller protein